MLAASVSDFAQQHARLTHPVHDLRGGGRQDGPDAPSIGTVLAVPHTVARAVSGAHGEGQRISHTSAR